MTIRLLIGAVEMTVLGGCSPSSPQPVALNHITLFASHGLWGGTNVFLKSDCTIWAQDRLRGQGQVERRFQGTLPPAELFELDALLSQHDVPSIRIPRRTGVPDEVTVTLEILLKDGRKMVLSAFERDVHAGFTPVYHWLRVHGERMDRSKPIYEGTIDGTWRPAGF